MENNENTMADLLEKVSSFTIFKRGKETKINKEDSGFDKIFSHLEEVFKKGEVMPAYGVSLHDETQNALLADTWLQINFDEQLTKNELPFSALLFRLDEVYGVDLIRLFNDRYDGRCIHLSFFEKVDLKSIIN